MSPAPIQPDSTHGQQHARGWPLLRLGFRPFYLGAALMAALTIPLWVAVFLGYLKIELHTAPLLWHAHEMLYGFACAVIVGFLLTAGQAWTGMATPRGALLGALVLLWLAARVAALTAPYRVYAAIDVVFLPIVAAIFLRLLVRAHNRRNMPLALILFLLAASNLLFHLANTGAVPLNPVTAMHAGLALIIMIECVMAGRVIPAFTMNATPGLKLDAYPLLERLTLALTAVGLALWVFARPGWLTLVVLMLAAALHLHRLWQWRSWVARGRPILWILHAAYAWIPVGLVLLALAQVNVAPLSAGLHALAVGTTAGLIIGMITRTARGHTGRSLQASRAEVTAYALVMLAALLRVLLPLLAPQWLVAALIGAATAWALAFGIYLVIYVPWLTQPRLDGRDG
jgi:uncharacterized protein involved in response to NO